MHFTGLFTLSRPVLGMKLHTLLLLFALGAGARAATINYTISSTIDATPFGGGPATPYVVKVSVSDVPEDLGEYVRYEVLAASISLGSETATWTGDEYRTYISNDVAANGKLTDYFIVSFKGSFSHTLLGHGVSEVNLILADTTGVMFSGGSLPVTSGFAAEVDTLNFSIDDTQFGALVYAGGAEYGTTLPPFTVTVPEPGVASVALLGALLLGGVRRRR